MPQLFKGSMVGDRWTVKKVVKEQPCQVCRVTDANGASGYLKYQDDPAHYAHPSYGRKRFLRLPPTRIIAQVVRMRSISAGSVAEVCLKLTH